MERICFILDIAPGTEAEYERRHAEAWPDLLDAIREAGIRNYSGFRRGTQVIYYGECHPDADTAFGKMGGTDVNTRWAKSFEGIITRLVGDDGKLITFKEVFHTD